MREITFIDFFAGIGGFRSGLEQTGMKCVGYCEFDRFARASYEVMYDTEGEWTAKDVRDVKGSDLPNADIWTFGFPCQDISIAGLTKGLTGGTRSKLFFEIMRLIDERKENKPEWLLVENVKNLLSIDKGWGFYQVLTEMAERGYSIEWKVYNSKDYGVPQNRERVFLVGHFGGECERPLLPVTRKGAATIKQEGNIRNTTSFGGNPQTGRVYSPEGISPTLNTCQGGGHEPKIVERSFVNLNMDPKVTDVTRCITARYTAGVTNHKGVNSGVIEAVPIKNATKQGYIMAEVGDGVRLSYPTTNRQRGRVQKQMAQTITTQNDVGVLMNYSPIRIRKLTPRECWRLQGFSDEQFDKAQAVNSNNQLYKQAGNAVTVNVAKAIGDHLMSYMKGDI